MNIGDRSQVQFLEKYTFKKVYFSKNLAPPFLKVEEKN
jgi:hypothetical protein